MMPATGQRPALKRPMTRGDFVIWPRASETVRYAEGMVELHPVEVPGAVLPWYRGVMGDDGLWHVFDLRHICWAMSVLERPRDATSTEQQLRGLYPDAVRLVTAALGNEQTHWAPRRRVA